MIQYLELKTGFTHNGPAWIAPVRRSKSGQTVYFDNKALKKLKSPRQQANHYDIETGECYWVSGIKKNGQDRHWAGSGLVLIEETILEEYLAEVDFNGLNKQQHQVVNITQKVDLDRFALLENKALPLEPSTIYQT